MFAFALLNVWPSWSVFHGFLLFPSGTDVEKKYVFGIKDDIGACVTTHDSWVIASSSEISREGGIVAKWRAHFHVKMASWYSDLYLLL